MFELRLEINELNKQITNCKNAIVLNKVTLKSVLEDNFDVDKAIWLVMTTLAEDYKRLSLLQQKKQKLEKEIERQTYELKKTYAKEILFKCCK